MSDRKDDARWFRGLGSCIKCKRPANGEVMGSRNQTLGQYCAKCGEARIKKARKERGEK